MAHCLRVTKVNQRLVRTVLGEARGHAGDKWHRVSRVNDLPSSIGLGMEWGEGMIERNAWVRTEG